MPRLIFVMDDGQKLEASFDRPPFPDVCAFERHFKMSSAVLDVSGALARKAVGENEDDLGEVAPDDAARFPRGEWMAFFGWRQLRRAGANIAASFDVFLDHVDELDIAPSPALGDEDGSLDPTSPEDQPPDS